MLKEKCALSKCARVSSYWAVYSSGEAPQSQSFSALARCLKKAVDGDEDGEDVGDLVQEEEMLFYDLLLHADTDQQGESKHNQQGDDENDVIEVHDDA